MSIIFRRAVAAIAITAALGACTPLQVVTHTVTQTEARVPVGPYKLDPHHTSVTFNVDHFKYTRFTMRFDRVAGEIDWKEGGLDKSQVAVTIDAASIDTNVPQLDKMVKGTDMLDAERNPQIRFDLHIHLPVAPGRPQEEADAQEAGCQEEAGARLHAADPVAVRA